METWWMPNEKYHPPPEWFLTSLSNKPEKCLFFLFFHKNQRSIHSVSDPQSFDRGYIDSDSKLCNSAQGSLPTLQVDGFRRMWAEDQETYSRLLSPGGNSRCRSYWGFPPVGLIFHWQEGNQARGEQEVTWRMNVWLQWLPTVMPQHHQWIN